jgi:GNAT superfamily N-acetyltransferase
MEILNLRALDAQRREALTRNFFECVYVPEFPESDISEDPRVWLPLMEGTPPTGQPMINILLALESADEVIGGLIMEHYTRSDCWLLTYLVVHPSHHQRGVAGELIASATTVARSAGNRPPLILAETEDPDQITVDAGTRKARERLHVLDRLGFRRVGVNYVQPALGAGKNPVDDLLLLCLVSGDRCDLPGARVVEFLHEFYAALGAAHDPYLTRIEAQISAAERVELKKLSPR